MKGAKLAENGNLRVKKGYLCTEVMNVKTESMKRIERMRNGEKIKCPKCEDGFFSAVGNPETTRIFKCSHCKLGMSLTVPMKQDLTITD